MQRAILQEHMMNFQFKIQAKKFAVSFKIFYDTIPGEDLCVIGSIPELGNWMMLNVILHGHLDTYGSWKNN